MMRKRHSPHRFCRYVSANVQSLCSLRIEISFAAPNGRSCRSSIGSLVRVACASRQVSRPHYTAEEFAGLLIELLRAFRVIRLTSRVVGPGMNCSESIGYCWVLRSCYSFGRVKATPSSPFCHSRAFLPPWPLLLHRGNVFCLSSCHNLLGVLRSYAQIIVNSAVSRSNLLQLQLLCAGACTYNLLLYGDSNKAD